MNETRNSPYDVDHFPHSRPIRIGVIGCGEHSRSQIMRALSAPGKKPFRFVAFSDTDLTAALSLRDDVQRIEKCDTAAFNPDSFLTNSTYNAAYVCTPHACHFEIISNLLRRNISVLSEKVLGISANECRSLLELSHKDHTPLSVAYPACFSDNYQHIKNLAATGLFGRFRAATGWAAQNWLATAKNTWRTLPSESGGGFASDTGAHAINLALDFLDDTPINIHARIDSTFCDVDVSSSIVFDLHRGGSVCLTLCGNGRSLTSMGSVTFIYEKGSIEVNIHGFYININTESDQKRLFDDPREKLIATFCRYISSDHDNPCSATSSIGVSQILKTINEEVKKNTIKTEVLA